MGRQTFPPDNVGIITPYKTVIYSAWKVSVIDNLNIEGRDYSFVRPAYRLSLNSDEIRKILEYTLLFPTSLNVQIGQFEPVDVSIQFGIYVPTHENAVDIIRMIYSEIIPEVFPIYRNPSFVQIMMNLMSEKGIPFRLENQVNLPPLEPNQLYTPVYTFNFYRAAQVISGYKPITGILVIPSTSDSQGSFQNA